MNELIKRVLLANSSQLGFNWIYNREFLNQYSKDNEMLMKRPNSVHYEENKPSYNVYSERGPGEFTLQGDVLLWLYNDWKNHDVYSDVSYKGLLLRHLMPGAKYSGYVESYGNKLVLNELNKRFKLKEVEMDDDQLVGFVPYIISKALNKPLSEALSLTYVLTNNKQYEYYFKSIDYLLKNGKSSLKEAVNLMPEEHKDKILKAILVNDANDFIKNTHDLSCSIDVAMPLIFHLYNKHDNLLSALKENIVLGGASSDRTLILALLYKDDTSLPKEWDSFF